MSTPRLHSSLPPSTSSGNGSPRRWLAVIDHHEARIFRSLERGSKADHIRPDQSDESISHTTSFDGFSRGQEKPAAHSFFGPIADALAGADRILILGGGTGTGNEMEQFTTWLTTHRPDFALRIAGSVIVDAHHLSDDQLLALARGYFSNPSSPPDFLNR